MIARKVFVGSYRGQSWLSRRIALFSAPFSHWPQIRSKNRLPSHSLLMIEYQSGHKECWESHSPDGWRCTPWEIYEQRLVENPKRWLHLEDLKLSPEECQSVVDVCMSRLRDGSWSDYPESRIPDLLLHRLGIGKVKRGGPPVCSGAVALVLWQAVNIDLRIWKTKSRLAVKAFEELTPWWVQHVPKQANIIPR